MPKIPDANKSAKIPNKKAENKAAWLLFLYASAKGKEISKFGVYGPKITLKNA